MEPEFLTTKELMELFKIKHRQTIYELIKDGMPAIQIGRSYRFQMFEVMNYLKNQSKEAAQISTREGIHK